MDVLLQRVKAEIESAVEGCTVEQLGAAADGKWSAAEVLQHLSLTYSSTARVFEKLAEEGQDPQTPVPTLKQRIAIFVVADLMHMPAGRKAPSFAEPKGADATTIRADTLSALDRMDKAIAAIESRWGAERRIATHPILGPMTISQWRRFHLCHTKHHARQVRERTQMARQRLAAGM